MILQKDISIVKEFLGSTENVSSMVSPLKCVRLYWTGHLLGNNYKNIIMVVTPMMYEHNSPLEFIIGSAQAYGIDLKIAEHKRGKNFVRVLIKK
jgi:hypothetical protein